MKPMKTVGDQRVSEAGCGARRERPPREPEGLTGSGHEQGYRRHAYYAPERDHGQRVGAPLEGQLRSGRNDGDRHAREQYEQDAEQPMPDRPPAQRLWTARRR
jgi:hypothetical protein